MTEGQILFNPIDVGCPEQLRVAQASPAFGILALEQMASARATMQDFACAGDFETFADGFPGLDSFGSSHSGRKLRTRIHLINSVGEGANRSTRGACAPQEFMR